MNSNDKAFVDSLFGTAPKPEIKSEEPKSKEECSSGYPSRENYGSGRDVLDMLQDMLVDYNRKLGLEMDCSNVSDVRVFEPTDKTLYMPFLAVAEVASMHFSHHLDTLSELFDGGNMDTLKNHLIFPMLKLASSVACRIHMLSYAPDPDLTGFDMSRYPIGGIMDEFMNMVSMKHTNNRQKWISMLCFDICTILLKTVTSQFILHEDDDDSNPMSRILRMPMETEMAPMFMLSPVTFVTKTSMTSQRLDEMTRRAG